MPESLYISKRYSSGRIKYLISGALFANLMPLCILVYPLWIFSIVYCLPPLLLDQLLRLHGLFVIHDESFLFLRPVGFLISVPFWALVGAFVGNRMFLKQAKNGNASLSVFNIAGVTAAAIIFTFLAVFVAYSFTLNIIRLVVYGV